MIFVAIILAAVCVFAAKAPAEIIKLSLLGAWGLLGLAALASIVRSLGGLLLS